MRHIILVVFALCVPRLATAAKGKYNPKRAVGSPATAVQNRLLHDIRDHRRVQKVEISETVTQGDNVAYKGTVYVLPGNKKGPPREVKFDGIAIARKVNGNYTAGSVQTDLDVQTLVRSADPDFQKYLENRGEAAWQRGGSVRTGVRGANQ
jgi:hypothetical protein